MPSRSHVFTGVPTKLNISTNGLPLPGQITNCTVSCVLLLMVQLVFILCKADGSCSPSLLPVKMYDGRADKKLGPEKKKEEGKEAEN
jgi:hypothetical protein